MFVRIQFYKFLFVSMKLAHEKTKQNMDVQYLVLHRLSNHVEVMIKCVNMCTVQTAC